MRGKGFCVDHGRCKRVDLTIVHGFNGHENCIMVVAKFIFQQFQTLRSPFPILMENWLEIVWDQIVFGQSKMCRSRVLASSQCLFWKIGRGYKARKDL